MQGVAGAYVSAPGARVVKSRGCFGRVLGLLVHMGAQSGASSFKRTTQPCPDTTPSTHQVAQHEIKLAGEAGGHTESLDVLHVAGQPRQARVDDHKQEHGEEGVGAWGRAA